MRDLRGLMLFFALVAWIRAHDVVADEKERLNSLYRALGRVDAGSSRQQFGGGFVGRWAGALREADYRSLTGSIAEATRRRSLGSRRHRKLPKSSG